MDIIIGLAVGAAVMAALAFIVWFGGWMSRGSH